MLEKNGCLYLLYAYDKSEYSNVDINIIKQLAKEMGL